MTDPADFLSRWSRRKRAAVEGRVDADETQASEPDASAPAVPEAQPESPEGKPGLDLSKLPSLDSIGPDTDVSVFLQPGVPASLRHAALRRVWVTDPAIRDFRAPQELDWDFNAPGLPGFGEIGPDIDVKKMAARILGGQAPDEPTKDLKQTPAVSESTTAEANYPSNADERGNVGATSNSDVVRCEENIAPQQGAESLSAKTRRHGRALPQ